MDRDIDEILIDRHQIAERVAEVARDITQQMADRSIEGELTLIPILTGSFIFVADLIRLLPVYMQIRLMSVSSYPGKATSTQGPKIHHRLTDLPDDLSGARLLIVDDIVDSGLTLRLVVEELKKRKPASIHTCVLLRKQRPEAEAIHLDYCCFEVPDKFVVGYGLDYNDRYRNLPDIVTLRDEVIRA